MALCVKIFISIQLIIANFSKLFQRQKERRKSSRDAFRKTSPARDEGRSEKNSVLRTCSGHVLMLTAICNVMYVDVCLLGSRWRRQKPWSVLRKDEFNCEIKLMQWHHVKVLCHGKLVYAVILDHFHMWLLLCIMQL